MQESDDGIAAASTPGAGAAKRGLNDIHTDGFCENVLALQSLTVRGIFIVSTKGFDLSGQCTTMRG